MKKLSFFVFLSSMTILGLGKVQAQCNPDNLANECIPKLQSGFNFLKSYKVDGEGGAKEKIEYSYVFTKGTQYMINLCSGSGSSTDGIVVSLFDSGRNKVATSKINGQFISTIAYP